MKVFNDRYRMPLRRKLRRESTLTERVFWAAVRAKGLDGVKIRRQVSVGPYVADFYVPSVKLVIELDGGVHFTPEAMEYDAARTLYLEAQGLKVIRFTNDQIHENLAGVLEEVLRATRARDTSPVLSSGRRGEYEPVRPPDYPPDCPPPL